MNYKPSERVKDDMCAYYAEFELVRGEPNIKDYCLTERSTTGRCRPQGLNFKPLHKPVVVGKVLTSRKK
jgi:hypothetical protein